MFAFQYMSVMEVVSSVKNSGGANGEPADGMSPFETGKRVRYANFFLKFGSIANN